MRSMVLLWAFVCALASTTATAVTVGAGEQIAIQDMTLTVPDGWALKQNARDEGTLILGFHKGAEYVTIFVKRQTGLDMRSIFANGSTVVRDVRNAPRNRYTWKLLETSKQFSAHNKTYHVASFLTEHAGFSYYGYSRSTSNASAVANVESFLTELR